MVHEKDMENILKGGINTYSKLKLKEVNKVRPFYRTREEQKRSKTANDKVKNWFKKDKNG